MREAAPWLLAPEPALAGETDDARLHAPWRAMQLSADRAGLLLAGDLAAAIRAIFLLSPRLQPALAAVEAEGLGAVLSRRDADGRLLLGGLAVRIAALVGFWLSDDYARLRQEMGRAAPVAVPAGAR